MKSGNLIHSAHKKTLNINGRLIDLSTPVVMGILNVTPDSFFGGSRFTTEAGIRDHTEKMLTEGAAFIDVGGYSSRPGAEDIPEQEELSRVLKAIRIIIKNFPDVIISIDTFRAEVARQAILEGASFINDISAGELDTKMFSTVATLRVPYITMHMRGNPQTMKGMTTYDNLIKDIIDYFVQKIFALQKLGIHDVIIDPGFGFSKTIEQNFELLTTLEHFKILDKPIMVGLSRKSMIWKTLERSPEDSLNGTTALHMAALLKGSSILRVHDVREAAETIKLYSRL